MNDLGAVVGGLLSGLAEARSVSDQVARQIAVSYAEDELLRLFPVPRIDFQSVEADIAVVLAELQEQRIPDERAPVAPSQTPEQLAQELLLFTYRMLNLSTNPRSKQGRLLHQLTDMYTQRITAFAESNKRTMVPTPLPMPRLQVGATAGEIEKAPPTAIGRIKLNVGVQNYEWVEVDRDANGEPIRRLVPTGR